MSGTAIDSTERLAMVVGRRLYGESRAKPQLAICLLMAAIALTQAPAGAADPSGQQAGEEAAAAKLVEQLGDDSWKVRENAQKELIRMGEPAIAELTRRWIRTPRRSASEWRRS